MSEVNKYAELKNSAEKATEGPWDAVADEDSAAGAIFVMPVCDQWVPPICRITSERDAIYVEEANPSVIIELIADFDAQRLRADTAEAEVARLEDEFDTLENTNTTIKLKLDAAERRIADLEKDAARYQWLRDKSQNHDQFYLSTPLYFTGVKFSKENVDHTIDAALNPNPEAESHE